MPSPLAHISVGYVMFRIVRGWFGKVPHPFWGSGLVLFGLCIFLSLLPDIDAVPGFLFSDLGKYHHNLTHSLVTGVFVSLLVAVVLKACGYLDFRKGYLLAVLSYWLHILMDYFSYGFRGTMLFWPITSERYSFPVSLFLGLRWEKGLWAIEHVWTFLTELLFAVALIVLFESLKRVLSRMVVENAMDIDSV